MPNLAYSTTINMFVGNNISVTCMCIERVEQITLAYNTATENERRQMVIENAKNTFRDERKQDSR